MIVFALVFIAEIYYYLSFIERLHQKAYFFNRYTEDAGIFHVNSSSMFNFIQLIDTVSNKIKTFDFKAYRAIGFYDVFADGFWKTKNHRTYGYCNKDTDTKY